MPQWSSRAFTAGQAGARSAATRGPMGPAELPGGAKLYFLPPRAGAGSSPLPPSPEWEATAGARIVFRSPLSYWWALKGAEAIASLFNRIPEYYRNNQGWQPVGGPCVGSSETFFKAFNPGDGICLSGGPGPGWNPAGTADSDDMTGVAGMSSWEPVPGRNIGSPFGWAYMTQGYERSAPFDNVTPVTTSAPGRAVAAKRAPVPRLGYPGVPVRRDIVSRGPRVGFRENPQPRRRKRTKPRAQYKTHERKFGSGFNTNVGVVAYTVNNVTEFGDLIDALWDNIPQEKKFFDGDPLQGAKATDVVAHFAAINWFPWSTNTYRAADGSIREGKREDHAGAIWDLVANGVQDFAYGIVGSYLGAAFGRATGAQIGASRAFSNSSDAVSPREGVGPNIVTATKTYEYDDDPSSYRPVVPINGIMFTDPVRSFFSAIAPVNAVVLRHAPNDQRR